MSDAYIENVVLTETQKKKHCRRYMRGVDETVREIEALIEKTCQLENLLSAEPILASDIRKIWEEEKKHVPCIQDVEGVNLYRLDHYTSLGTKQIPVYKCVRGTNAVERFHSFSVNFVPGETSGSLPFHLYMMEGTLQRNAKMEAIASGETEPIINDRRAVSSLNALSVELIS